MTTARSSRILGSLRNVVDVLDGARSAAAALNSHRKPSRQALRKLGIDEHAFDDMHI